MKIDLQKLGLTSDSTFEEIQTALNGQEFFDHQELETASNAAAAGARKAALAQAKKNQNILSDDEMKEFNKYKENKKLEILGKDKTLAKFDQEDRELIIKANGLLAIEDEEELQKAIQSASKKYAHKMNNGMPDEIVETPEEKAAAKAKANEESKKRDSIKNYRPGDLKLFDEPKPE